MAFRMEESDDFFDTPCKFLNRKNPLYFRKEGFVPPDVLKSNQFIEELSIIASLSMM